MVWEHIVHLDAVVMYPSVRTAFDYTHNYDYETKLPLTLSNKITAVQLWLVSVTSVVLTKISRRTPMISAPNSSRATTSGVIRSTSASAKRRRMTI